MIVTLGKALLALALTAFPAAAMAADIAALNVIGFSRDGQLFAFEEYGVQDGSGFPYSNIFVVDLVKDEFAEGTPVRTRIDDESAGLKQVRALSTEKAAHMLDKGGFGDDPGVLLAFNPVTEAGADPYRLSFNPYPGIPLRGMPTTIALTIEPRPAVFAECMAFEEPNPSAFRLSLTEIDGAPAKVPVYSDGPVPRSRGCVTGYQIGAVAASMKDPSVKVALILVWTHGFEGDDGRFIAVPLKEEERP